MATPNDTTTPLKKRCTGCGFECDYTEAPAYFNHRRGGFNTQCKACRLAYRVAHREQIAAQRAVYRAEHREELAAYRAIYQQQHRAQRAAYYIAHRKERAAYNAVYRQTERGKQVIKACSHNRRLQKQVTGGALTADGVALVLAAHTDSKGRLRCARCGKVIKGKYHLDHFIPLKEGGTNDPGNFRVMHPECNQSKGATHPHKLGMLI